MAEEKWVVAIRPFYEKATMYGQYWTRRYVNQMAPGLRYGVVDLYKEKCVQYNLKKAVEERNVVLIAGVAHGNKDIIVGQDSTVLFKVGDSNTKEIVKGKHVWMLSCLAGQELLPWMVNKCGAITAMGYKDTFVFVISDFPNSYAQPFFDSHFAGVTNLLHGRTAGTAFNMALMRFKKYIDDDSVPEKIKPYLLHDKNCAVLFGDPDAKIEPPESSPPTPPPDGKKEAKIVVRLKKKREGEGRAIFTVIDDGDEKPIQGAVIKMYGQTYKGSGVTDENGKCIFDNIPVERYEYEVSKEGYEKASGIIKPEDFQ